MKRDSLFVSYRLLPFTENIFASQKMLQYQVGNKILYYLDKIEMAKVKIINTFFFLLSSTISNEPHDVLWHLANMLVNV